jgi:predicted dehydrogenase
VAMVNELTRYHRFELQIQGADGLIVLADGVARWWRGVDRTDRINEPDSRIEWYALEPEPFPAVAQQSSILAAVRELVDCLASGATPSSPGEDGVASLEMVMGVYESQRQGNCAVTLPLTDRESILYRLRGDGHF